MGGGPVHINLETERGFTFNTEILPAYRVIRRVTLCNNQFPELPDSAKIVVMLGAHKRFTQDESDALARFVRSRNAAVVLDRTGNYYGDGAVLSAMLCQQNGSGLNPKYAHLVPDLVIHIGEISGDYDSMWVGWGAKTVWRVSEDGEVRNLYGQLSYVFEMAEKSFFEYYTLDSEKGLSYSTQWRDAILALRSRLPVLPFSNIWMASQLCDKFLVGSELQVGIFNSLRTWNMFVLPDGVSSNCNVGGFGIDGALSTLIGASLASPNRTFFAVVGDLAFFYDLKALGNRHIGKNVRILLVNNGCGGEFNLYTHPGHQFGEQVNDYIAAGRHFGPQSKGLVCHYASDLGFHYLSASNKKEFMSESEYFLDPKVDASIVFECFVDPNDDSEALGLIKAIDPYTPPRTLLGEVKKHMPSGLKSMIKAVVR